MSDRALSHGLYLAKISGAQLVILHVIESEAIPPSALLTFIQPERGLKGAKEDLRSTFEEAARRMLDQRVRESKDGGIANIEYIIRAGKPVDEIVNESESGNYDLVVMASSRITSKVRVLGSNVRRVLDSITRPVLVIHE
ncbi:MAG: universal stress protein [Thermoproteota archaeon]|nr:universal stress protein [Thermoproteota archaeon]